MKKFCVQLLAQQTVWLDLEVEAETEGEAEAKALEMARGVENYEWDNGCDTEMIRVEHIEEIEEGEERRE